MAKQQPGISENGDMPKKSIADLFNDLPYRHYPHKHMIIYQGDTIDRIYYIISGYVRMYTITAKGNERTLAILGPGESLPLIQSDVAQYFYDALTDIEAAYASYDEVVKRFLADDDYMEVARESGVKLMQRMMEQMDFLAADTALDKLSAALLFLAKYYGEQGDGYSTIKFRVTHQELGNLVNLSRETVSSLMQKLEKRKLFIVNKSGFMKVYEQQGENSADDGAKKLSFKLNKGIRPRSVADSELAA